MTMAKIKKSEGEWFVLWPSKDDGLWEGASYSSEEDAIENASYDIVANEHVGKTYVIVKATHRVTCDIKAGISVL